MMVKKTFRNAIILLVVFCNIGCDQVSKTVARESLEYNQRIDVIDNFFTLIKVENAGAFLSLGESLPAFVKFLLLSLLPCLVLVTVLYYVFSKKDLKTPVSIGLCFVVGGGIGNLYDRILHGSVTDFLHLNFTLFQTGIFNIADVSIMFGMALTLIYSFQRDINKEPEEPLVQ